MYGSENWFLNGSDKRKIEAADKRFLRPMTGYTLGQKWMTTDYHKKFNYKPEGRRNIGRSQTRWDDDFWEEGTGQGA